MFTGIVEEMGTVVSMKLVKDLVRWDGSIGEGYELVVQLKIALEGVYLGASISINGVCLTATSFDKTTCTFGVAPETLRCTNLGSLKQGDRVNVERAAVSGGRNSGHYVQGHVDATGAIVKKWVEGESLWIRVQPPKRLMPYIVPKGFIAIDGTSLTVCDVNHEECWFTFMLVEYTQKHIIIPHKSIGETVNLEVDAMGKYVEKSLNAFIGRVEELEKKVLELTTIIQKGVAKL